MKDLKRVRVNECPNCHSTLILFTFNCPACSLSFISTDDFDFQTLECPLCNEDILKEAISSNANRVDK